MKKYLILLMLSGGILLTGCSVDLDMNSTQSERLSSEAEELAAQVELARADISPLQDKEILTKKEVLLIVEKIDDVMKKIYEFEEEETSFVVKMAQKLAVKELKKKEEILSSIQEKAINGTLAKDDVRLLVSELSPDFEYKLFQ